MGVPVVVFIAVLFGAVPCRADEPAHGFRIALLHATTDLVAQAEIALSRREFLLGGGTIPFDRLGKILFDDLAGLVKTPRLNCAAG